MFKSNFFNKILLKITDARRLNLKFAPVFVVFSALSTPVNVHGDA